MFWFLLISLAVVVAAVTLAVVGSSGDGRGGAAAGGLADAPPDMLDEPLPAGRPVNRVDVDALRLPVTARGYRMQQVDDVLDRLGAELAERDARIAELESALAGVQATAMVRGDSAAFARPAPRGGPTTPPPPDAGAELPGEYGELPEPEDLPGPVRPAGYDPGSAGPTGSDAGRAVPRDPQEPRDGR